MMGEQRQDSKRAGWRALAWKAKGSPLPIAGGPRKGTLVAYVSGPDHITIELMQPPAR